MFVMRSWVVLTHVQKDSLAKGILSLEELAVCTLLAGGKERVLIRAQSNKRYSHA
jgi:hypothetical protein